MEAVVPADGGRLAGFGVGKSLPEVSQALLLQGGPGEPSPTGSPHLTWRLREGDLAWVRIPSPRGGSLSGVVPMCSVHSMISRLVWPFVTLGYFPPKVQEMGKKNDFVYLLSVAFWTLIPGAAYRRPARGLWHLFQASEADEGMGP